MQNATDEHRALTPYIPYFLYERRSQVDFCRRATVLNPTDGRETLAQATDVFRYIDRNFEHWNCDTAARATKETPVQVYEMVRDGTFQERGYGREAAINPHKEQLCRFQEGRALQVELMCP
jgi:hypothetical protein